MPLVAIQGIDFVQRFYLPVNPNFCVATFAKLVEKLAVMSLAASYQWS